jgi:4-amino-4-deoxy-L-arabinose transferase-like glycosyltransferase
VQDPIRPFFFFASATPLYWAFGTSPDVATMVNVVYWLILLASIYGLGCHLGGPRLGAWGAILTALVPMLYAMSRSFYIEFSLTALVALALYFLVASQGFQRREMALAFGVALGLGMLTKRTYPLFLAGPVLIAILHSRVLRSMWNRLRGGLRISLPDLLIAVGIGLSLTALWYLPNRAQAGELVLGQWLFPAWALLAAVTVYLLLRRPKDPGVNCLSALSLGASIASLWYLPRSDVIQRLLLYGYGVGDPRGRELKLTNIYTYTYYPRYTIDEGLGLGMAALFAMVMLGIVIWLFRKNRWRRIWQADSGWWVLAFWPLGAYLLLTFSIYKEARALLPILPGLVLIVAAGLVVPRPRLGRGLLGLAVAWGVLQFAVISYTEYNRPAQQTQFSSSLLGDAGLFARGTHIELPDSGSTDPGYNIQSNVLARVDAMRRLMAQPSIRLGVLAQTPQINAGSFLYSILTWYRAIQVGELARNYEGGDPMPRLYGYEYLLVKRQNEDVDELAQVAIDRILDGPPHLFTEAYLLETTYPLPDGDTAFLYRLRSWPDPSLPESYTREVSQYLSTMTRPDDALILSPSGLLTSLSQQQPLAIEVHLLPDIAGAHAELPRIAADHRRLFVLLGGPDLGPTGEFVEGWLNQHAYRADNRWFGSLQLVLYGTTVLPPADQATEMSGVRFGGYIELTGTDLPGEEFKPGDVLPLTLFWEARQPVAGNLKVFAHLLDRDGRLVAQQDSEPVGGLRPTSTWGVEEPIVDRHGILLPGDLLAGDYQVAVGLYDPVSGDRLPVTSGGGESDGDALLIGSIHVEP